MDNSTTTPKWLSKIETFDGNWKEYEKKLYKLFGKTIKSRNFKLCGMPISYDKRRTINGKEEIFYHLISKQDPTHQDDPSQRLPDLTRCERLGWIREIIDHIDSKEIKIMMYDHTKRPRDIRTIIFVPSLNYVIILRKRDFEYILITAYQTTPNRSKYFERHYINQ